MQFAQCFVESFHELGAAVGDFWHQTVGHVERVAATRKLCASQYCTHSRIDLAHVFLNGQRFCFSKTLATNKTDLCPKANAVDVNFKAELRRKRHRYVLAKSRRVICGHRAAVSRHVNNLTKAAHDSGHIARFCLVQVFWRRHWHLWWFICKKENQKFL